MGKPLGNIIKMIVYFRDDDLGYNDIGLSSFLKVFVGENVPLNMEAIPARCYQNRQMLKVVEPFLKSNLFEIHQHGVSHLEYDLRQEFADYRSYSSVEEDILVGKKCLEVIFGRYFKPYFTPPWNYLSEIFLPIIRKNFIKISPIDLPVQIDLRVNDGKVRWKSYEELVKEFDKLALKENKIGILIHHYLFFENDPNLEILRKFIQYLKSQGVEFKKFSEL
jgi:peptidoglycan/xylan/chitin deacetylase (PgdA/CDA1 family)